MTRKGEWGADMSGTACVWTLKALTPIWTGDAERRADRLVTTGLLGSIRWWFEVVVRGLGGRACDPSHHEANKHSGPCPQSGKKPHDRGHHCVVCELFGCTDWARKFRFDVLGDNGKAQQEQITAGQTFQLRFTPLRSIDREEWGLLDLTIQLIAKYGALGGKTVYKPTDETGRESKPYHQDYGLVTIGEPHDINQLPQDVLRRYIVSGDHRWRIPKPGGFGWASLENFWYVSRRYLARQAPKKSDFNRVLGRKEDKSKKERKGSKKERKGRKVVRWSDLLLDNKDQTAAWLAGRQQESKKVFSFKNPESARRTFGFVQSTDKLVEMRQRLREKAWDDLDDGEFVTGGEILRRLLGEEGGSQ